MRLAAVVSSMVFLTSLPPSARAGGGERDATGSARQVGLRTLQDRDEDLALAQAMLDEVAGHLGAGRFAEALRPAQAALDLLRRHLPDDDARLAEAMAALASVLQGLGELDEARELYADALEVQTQADPQDPAVAVYLANLGYVAYLQGDLLLASTLLEQSLDVSYPALGSADPIVTDAMANLAVVRSALGRYAEAVELLLAVLDGREEHDGRDSLEMAAALALLGGVYFEWSQDLERRPAGAGERQQLLAHAERAAGMALESFRGSLPRQHPELAAAAQLLGRVLLAQGELAAAEERRQRERGETEQADRLRAEAEAKLNEADRLLSEALSAHEASYGEASRETARTLVYLAAASRARGQRRTAADLLERARTIQEGLLEAALSGEHGTHDNGGGENSESHATGQDESSRSDAALVQSLQLELAETLHQLGRTYTTRATLEQARDYLERAIALWEAAQGAPVRLAPIVEALARVAAAQGRENEAAALRERARRLRAPLEE